MIKFRRNITDDQFGVDVTRIGHIMSDEVRRDLFGRAVYIGYTPDGAARVVLDSNRRSVHEDILEISTALQYDKDRDLVLWLQE